MNKMEEVKSAALSLFALKGFTATSMQDIADAVGLNKASLYFYVKSKKELYLLVVDEQFSYIKEELRKVFESYGDEPIDVLLFQAFKTIVLKPSIEWLLLWKRMHMLSITDLGNGLQKPLHEIINKNMQRTWNFLNDFIRTKNIEINEDIIPHFVFAFDTFVRGVLDWRLLNPDADANAVIPIIWNQFWNGSRFV